MNVMADNPGTRLPGRALDDLERSTLMFLLSVDFVGRDAFLRQADTARVVGKCDCGCATIDLWVDHHNLAAAVGAREPVPVEARSKEEGEAFTELLLFAKEGWLQSFESVYVSEKPPAVFPPTEYYLPPEPNN